MNYYDLYVVKLDGSRGSCYIDHCNCRKIYEDDMVPCSECKCKIGLTFENAKELLIKYHINDIKNIEKSITFEEYKYNVR